MKEVRVAVVGVGYWGPNLVRNLLKIPKVKIVGVCEISKYNLSKFSKNYPSIKTTSNYKQLLEDDTIDLIAIATPVTTHYKLAHEALLANKHILLEKPMTRTVTQALSLIRLARQKQRLIMVSHTYVYSGAVQKIKELILKKELGDIYYFDSIRINSEFIKSDVNVIWDLAPHDLSILNFIFAEKPLTIQALYLYRKSPIPYEMAHLMIKYQKGIIAHIHVNWPSPVKIRKILIGGSKKLIIYDDIEPSEKIRIYETSVPIDPTTVTPFAPAYRSGNVSIPQLNQTEALYAELVHCIDCIRKKTIPITDGVDGMKVVELLEACDKALAKKTEIQLHG